MIYAPVCGEDGLEYGNACEAECKNINYTNGKCPIEGTGMIRVIDAGSFPCNILIILQSQEFVPLNIDSVFLKDSLLVHIKGRPLLDYVNCTPNLIKEKIEILFISLQ